jgi:hypothetical protein
VASRKGQRQAPAALILQHRATSITAPHTSKEAVAGSGTGDVRGLNVGETGAPAEFIYEKIFGDRPPGTMSTVIRFPLMSLVGIALLLLSNSVKLKLSGVPLEKFEWMSTKMSKNEPAVNG